MNPILKSLYPAFLRAHILHHAAEGPIYGVEMIEELGRHGYRLSPGTLYPILHTLERGGYLKQRSMVVGGRARKYYAITALGRKTLREIKIKVWELAREVLDDTPRSSSSRPARPGRAVGR